MCFKWGHLKTIEFPFGTNGKVWILDIHILKHNRVLLPVLLNPVHLFAIFFKDTLISVKLLSCRF